MNWNPATGVNDLEEIRRLIEAVRPGSKKQTTVSEVLVDMSSFYERSRNEFLPRLIDEVERLRRENQDLLQSNLWNRIYSHARKYEIPVHTPGWLFRVWREARRNRPFMSFRDRTLCAAERLGQWPFDPNDDLFPTKFIPLSEWLPMFQQWQKKQEAKA